LDMDSTVLKHQMMEHYGNVPEVLIDD